MNGVGIFQRPTVEDQIRRQVEQYLQSRALDYFGDRRMVPVDIALEMCITLTKHLTDRIETYEKLAYDEMMTRMSSTILPAKEKR